MHDDEYTLPPTHTPTHPTKAQVVLHEQMPHTQIMDAHHPHLKAPIIKSSNNASAVSSTDGVVYPSGALILCSIF